MVSLMYCFWVYLYRNKNYNFYNFCSLAKQHDQKTTIGTRNKNYKNYNFCSLPKPVIRRKQQLVQETKNIKIIIFVLWQNQHYLRNNNLYKNKNYTIFYHFKNKE